MILKAKVLSKYNLPKMGNTVIECEDVYSYKQTNGLLKISLADGATESSFAKEWASLLTRKIDNLVSVKKVLDKLPSLRNQWLAEVKKVPLPWYAEQKLEKGAFATLLSFSVDLKTHTYNCIAIGDCCLFHIKKDNMFYSFPIQQSNEFSNTPYLLSSTNNLNDIDLPKYIKESKNKKVEKNDYLFLMSDALAHWFFKESENNEKPWEVLLGLSESVSYNAFENWLNTKRKRKEIRNDDTTLLIIEMS